MILLLDYDDTYTVDPEFWNKFILIAKDSGHKIYGLTMRYNNETESIESTFGKYCEIIYTGRNAKKPYVHEWFRKRNIKPEPIVYIDDSPYFLLFDG